MSESDGYSDSGTRALTPRPPPLAPPAPRRPAPPAPAAARPFSAAQHLAAIVEHRLVRTQGSRAVDHALGAQAAAHPAAQAAASTLLRRVLGFVAAVDPTFDASALLGSFERVDGDSRPRYSADGDVHPEHVPEVLATGNLREKMTLAFNALGPLQAQLTEHARRAETDPAHAAWLRAHTDVPWDAVQRRLTEHAARGGGLRLFDPDPSGAYGRTMRLRRKTSAATAQANRSVGRLGGSLTTPRVPALSPRERAHIVAAHVSESGSSSDESGPDVASVRLPVQAGKYLWTPNGRDPWVADAISRRLSVTAGISRTTYRLLLMGQLLGGTPAEAQALRLACLGYLVPNHHSSHEVLSAATAFGLPYRGTPAEAETLLRQLRHRP